MITTSPEGAEPTLRTDLDVAPEASPSARTSPQPPSPGSFAGRPLLYLVAAVILSLMVLLGGLIWFVTSTVAIELSVDGQSQPIETRADTVGDLLADQGIAVAGDDLIVPGVESELVEGQVVEVRYARPLALTIDGIASEHTTTELRVGDALAVIGAPVEGSAISVALDEELPRNGAALEIITPKSVALDIGGQTTTITSTAKTVGELRAAEGIVLADDDIVSPSDATVVTEAIAITVTRIRIENEVRIEAIAHDTVETEDVEATVGSRRTITDGVDGERQVTYAMTYTNGEVTSERELSAMVTAEPVTEVIGVGSKPAPAPVASASPGGATGDLNWAALAQCESSGNPKAVNPAGYYGLYQFSLPTWASVGGSGNPADASPAEQTNRAHILYEKAGAGQWPSCGPLLFR